MTINIVAVGKLKEKYWRDACDEYIKRLAAFGKVSITELSEVRLKDEPSAAEIKAALAKESEEMRKFAKIKNAANVALCIEGDMLSSVQLSERLKQFALNGRSTVNFFVGSSFGIDEDLKKECDLRLSMSRMTFPHQLARVMLTEQVYRAFSIGANSKYHK